MSDMTKQTNWRWLFTPTQFQIQGQWLSNLADQQSVAEKRVPPNEKVDSLIESRDASIAVPAVPTS